MREWLEPCIACGNPEDPEQRRIIDEPLCRRCAHEGPEALDRYSHLRRRRPVAVAMPREVM